MKIITQEVQDIYFRIGVKIQNIFTDDKGNLMVNNYKLFADYEKEIIEILDISLEELLYTKYFWYTLFLKNYIERIGHDIGIEQGQFKLIEEIDQITEGGVKWDIIEQLEESIINGIY